jgi:hypothetical protein
MAFGARGLHATSTRRGLRHRRPAEGMELVTRLRLMLGGFGRSGEKSDLALVLKPEAFTIDADDGRVVKDAIEHRGGEHAVAGEGRYPSCRR